MPHKGRLNQALLKRMAETLEKPVKYVREQVSKRASKLSITSEAAQVVWAKQLGIGTAHVLRHLDPPIQDQIRAALPITFHPTEDNSQEPSGKGTTRKPVDTISLAADFLLHDGELRSRCKDLLARKKHLDRSVREATTVLEDRIRRLSGVPEPLPEALVNRAINPDPAKAKLVVSPVSSEQAGFHSICRGRVLAYRHKAHHHLDDNLSREDALKFCAFVDILLAILAGASRRP